MPPLLRDRRRRAGALLLGLLVLGTALVVVRSDDGLPHGASGGFPALDDPLVLDVRKSGRVVLDDDRDYIVRLPCSPVELEDGLRISGGRNVRLVGGEVVLPEPGRGLLLKGQTGTILVEGLKLSGALTEGINLDQRKGASVHLRNTEITTVAGSREGNHADLLQTWAGPRELVVDGFRGTSDYQGMFLLPRQRSKSSTPERVSLSRVHLTMTQPSAYALWRDDDDDLWRPELDDVFVESAASTVRKDLLWPKEASDASWDGAVIGAPPAPVLTTTPGADYPRPDGCAGR